MKKIVVLLVGLIMALTVAGCTEADQVSYKVQFELIGAFSLDATGYPKISVIVEKDDGEYLKHIIGLNEDTFYIVEDIGGAAVNKYKYEINYIPETIVPFTVKSED